MQTEAHEYLHSMVVLGILLQWHGHLWEILVLQHHQTHIHDLLSLAVNIFFNYLNLGHIFGMWKIRQKKEKEKNLG